MTAQLYDQKRDLYYAKPLLRGWLHLGWFVTSLVVGPLLLASARGRAEFASLAVYTGSVSGLFGVSALYHCGNWGVTASRRLQRLDHVMIYILIAGTATPIFALTSDAAFGLTCLIAMWSLTALATVLHLARMSAPEILVGLTFVGLGTLAGLALPAVWMHAGVAAASLVFAGGLLFMAGAFSYYRRSPDPSPTIFGYHEVFHAYVCAAAACHYVAIAVFIS
ncbi:MAG: hemolysin III family protein [Actinomycetota bacterium]|nr:hemolysin III family protein [Actinomycetota bacterium]